MTVALIGTSGRNKGHPFKLIGGMTLARRVNLYAYVNNEPIYQTDRNGLFPGESGAASSGGCGPDEAPFGQAPDGTSVDPARLTSVQRCITAFLLACGLHLGSVEPTIEDAYPEPKAPVVTPDRKK